MATQERIEVSSTLTWRGRFAGITNVVNCYSETEDVVGNPRQALTAAGGTREGQTPVNMSQ